MRIIEINNQEVLDVLNQFLYFVNNPELDSIQLLGQEANREWYTGEDYRKHIISLGTAHDGYPETMRGRDFKYQYIRGSDQAVVTKCIDQYTPLNAQLQAILGVRHNALCAVYPPNGFIGWHNNANASAYNLIITWSETGDGYWEHVDGETGELVHIADKPGWTCKAGYFGSYQDPQEKLVYHCASTNCWRMTISYTFNRDDRGRAMWEMVQQDLNSPT